ncbi:diguanylate cyclase [Vibrio sp. Isolate23]|uniref:TackOD1 domain-containing metal-binding protein n=1 Tax=Vibrio sp. Isolate23 TaxID=2908533 RepID=UPI001EFEC667|nr:diguanylate cyclase [Vibrio sp. Isolate23]MCG9683250.1 diguanylate cyclase [Vibrio sp. Isolate23]
MPTPIKNFYWLSDTPPSSHLTDKVIYVRSVQELPEVFGGAACIAFSNQDTQKETLKAFYQQKLRWSWCLFSTEENTLTTCLTDGLFDENTAFDLWHNTQKKLSTASDIQALDPIIGWLGVNRERRITSLKNVSEPTIYQYPLIEFLYPELDSAYRYALSEQSRNILEKEHLIDRIRLCSQCNSGHLNYVDVCPICQSIDIESQSSLHCFTCGHVDDQQAFTRKGKLACPKCLTQLRHIGVDYDRPLENQKCHTCSNMFVEASTITQCMSCDSKVPVHELIERKIYQYKLGESGQYIYQHGKATQAPELSIKGKVEAGYFVNLISWLNKVALRHNENHLILALYLPSIDHYGQQHGDTKLFALIEQITARLSGLFRDTDICCQYKQDVLLVLMPKTHHSSLSAIQNKLSALSKLIEEDDFELNVFARSLPDHAFNGDPESWLEALLREIYAV